MHGHVIKLKTQGATPDDLMTVRQFAEKRGCSKSYIYKLRDQQKIKLYPRGRLKVSESEALKAMEG